MKTILLSAVLCAATPALADGSCTTQRFGDGVEMQITCSNDDGSHRVEYNYSRTEDPDTGRHGPWQMDGWHNEVQQ